MTSKIFLFCLLLGVGPAYVLDELNEGDSCGHPYGSKVYMRRNGILLCEDCNSGFYLSLDSKKCEECRGDYTNNRRNVLSSCKDEVTLTTTDEDYGTRIPKGDPNGPQAESENHPTPGSNLGTQFPKQSDGNETKIFDEVNSGNNTVQRAGDETENLGEINNNDMPDAYPSINVTDTSPYPKTRQGQTVPWYVVAVPLIIFLIVVVAIGLYVYTPTRRYIASHWPKGLPAPRYQGPNETSRE